MISGSSAISKSSLNIWKSRFMYFWNLAWRIFRTTLLACEMSAIVQLFEHSLALPFLGIGMKTDLFQSRGHCWVFQISLHIEYSTFTASSFRIWNSSIGISLPPLAFFLVMLLGPTWLHIPGCLALGARSQNHDYLGYEDFFFLVEFFWVLLAPLLNIFCFC